MTAATATTKPAPRPSSGGMRSRWTNFADHHRSSSILIGMAIAGLLLGFLPILPPLNFIQSANPWYDAFANAGVYVLLAMGLNVVVGLAGLLDLGYAAFFAIGAYTYAYSNSPYAQQDLPFFPMLFVGAAVAAVFGIALGAPTLRLRGDYLAIMTLGFGEIVPIVFVNSDPFTNGTNGIGGIYRPEALPVLGEFSPLTSFNYMIVMIVIVTLAMMLLYRLHDSRIGRAWMAIREDELAAAANGINTVATKLLAFALGATTSGLAGVFNASKLTIVSPDQFSFTVSFTVIAMIIVGGMGNIWGVAVGAFVVFMIQAVVLKQLSAIAEQLASAGLIPQEIAHINFVEYQYLLFGIALVVMMLKRPEGLFPSQVRRAELHEVLEPEVAAADIEAEAAVMDEPEGQV
ncbi:MAG TPA: branched-chain amino acid ABC transporter permease [Candidatus Limnocylindrales bacterium]|jgi:ABC-type branched-subunit amino acid transport system permease subunit|nr:branched-chain amino acid ABC transporter permease [Candidatus Limnocylindrales bacterium]